MLLLKSKNNFFFNLLIHQIQENFSNKSAQKEEMYLI